MKNSKKFVLLMMMALLMGITYVTMVETIQASSDSQLTMIFGDGLVLGDDDDKDEDDHDDSGDDDEDKDEDRSGSSNDSSDDDEDDDDHDEDEDEDDDEDSDRYRSEEQIQNADGTVTYIKRDEEDGKSEIELKTYDASGRLIEERKLKQEDHDGDEGVEIELESYVYSNGDLKELKIKSKDGKEIEISVKDSVEKGKPSKVRYEVAEQQLKIKIGDNGRELSIISRGDHFEIHDGVLGAKVGLPITVDPDSGLVFVETAIGLVRVGISPEKALEITQENDDFLHNEDEVELVEDGNGLEYKITAQKQEKLLGLFPISVDAEYSVDAETGEYTGLDQSFWTRVLDLISF